MLIQSQAGALPANRQLGGTPNNPAGIFGEANFSELAPIYSTLTKNGKIFTASAALVTLSASSTTATGLILWNSSSQTDLHLLYALGNVAVTSATLTTIWLGKSVQAAIPTGLTAAVQTNGYLNQPTTGAGLAYTAATISVAPTAVCNVMHNTAAIATTGEDAGFDQDFHGSIIVPPGMLVAFYGNTASAATAVNLTLAWAELPA